jgi:hypothetical protein
LSTWAWLVSDVTSGDFSSLTAGLGVITAALVAGQFLFYKFVYQPALSRADKTLLGEQERCRGEVDIERARAERLEAKIDHQNAVLENKALPALIAATTTVSQFQELMQEMRTEQTRLQHQREIDEARRESRGA